MWVSHVGIWISMSSGKRLLTSIKPEKVQQFQAPRQGNSIAKTSDNHFSQLNCQYLSDWGWLDSAWQLPFILQVKDGIQGIVYSKCWGSSTSSLPIDQVTYYYSIMLGSFLLRQKFWIKTHFFSQDMIFQQKYFKSLCWNIPRNTTEKIKNIRPKRQDLCFKFFMSGLCLCLYKLLLSGSYMYLYINTNLSLWQRLTKNIYFLARLIFF